MNYVGYRRGEVYRFGLILKDERGRSSFVKWIGDIKMPDSWERETTKSTFTTPSTGYNYDIVTHDVARSKLYAHVLNVKFTVSNLPAGTSYEIVRVKREEWDKTIVAQGFYWAARKSTADYWDAWVAAEGLDYGDLNTNVGFFFSPEISMYKDLHSVPGDQLQILGTYTLKQAVIYKTVINKMVSTNIINGGITSHPTVGRRNIAASVIVEQSDHEVRHIIDNNVSVINYALLDEDANQYIGFQGTNLACSLTAPVNTVDPGNTTFRPRWINYIRDTSQYGGNSYTARTYNMYMACTQVLAHSTEGTAVNVYGGDTFICMWDQLHQPRDKRYASSDCGRINYLPVETSINLSLTHDYPYHRRQPGFTRRITMFPTLRILT
jgi:hypothetical protein